MAKRTSLCLGLRPNVLLCLGLWPNVLLSVLDCGQTYFSLSWIAAKCASLCLRLRPNVLLSVLDCGQTYFSLSWIAAKRTSLCLGLRPNVLLSVLDRGQTLVLDTEIKTCRLLFMSLQKSLSSQIGLQISGKLCFACGMNATSQ